MGRKSSRAGGKRKWPCGVCSSQCNDNAVICEDCGFWFHAKCEKLSDKDFKVLRQLTEGYIHSSCTHTNGQFDYDKSLLRLENSVRNGMLECCVKMEIILLPNTPLTHMKAEVMMLGSQKVDAIARDILMKAGEYYVYMYVCKKYDRACLQSAKHFIVFVMTNS